MVLYREGIIITYTDPDTGIIVRAIPPTFGSSEINVMIPVRGPQASYNEVYRKRWPQQVLLTKLGSKEPPVASVLGLEKELAISEIEALNRDRSELWNYFARPWDINRLGVKRDA